MKQIDGYAALLASANADVKRLSAYADKLEALLTLADERIHRLYECRLEGDKLLVMIERYEMERKRRAK